MQILVSAIFFFDREKLGTKFKETNPADLNGNVSNTQGSHSKCSVSFLSFTENILDISLFKNKPFALLFACNLSANTVKLVIDACVFNSSVSRVASTHATI